MADIITSGTNTIATFTDKKCSQADMYLNISPNEELLPLSRTQQLILRTILETMRKVLGMKVLNVPTSQFIETYHLDHRISLSQPRRS
jgi:hypothetical protein